MLITIIWREVSLARTKARIVEAELAAETRMAELEALASQQATAGADPLLLVLLGFGAFLAVATLLRPTIILGR